jgi:3-oxoacyl-[acyl-carrier protein] reductase
MQSPFDLTGMLAVVTGCRRGIGLAMVDALAAAGADIVGISAFLEHSGSEAQRRVEARGRTFIARPTDLSDVDAVRALARDLAEQPRRVDILVNNAGIGGKAAPIWEQSDSDWLNVININLTGVFLCCRAVINHMREREYGRIVNIASVAGKDGNPNMTAYSASKAGVIGLTKSIAKEVAEGNICVNSVTPAVIRTPILEQLTPEQVDYMTSRIPRRRTGRIEEVAAVVHVLASPDCSFVTGQTYDVSGGRSTY